MGKTKTYKVVSLFSGAGGLDSGFYVPLVFMISFFSSALTLCVLILSFICLSPP